MSQLRQRPYSVFVSGEFVGTVWADDQRRAVERIGPILGERWLRTALRTLLVKRRTA